MSTLMIPPLVAGLSTRRKSADPLVRSWICEAPWAQLQVRPFGPIIHPNPIDQALDAVKQGAGPFRVRPFFGQHSPAFAFDLADGAVTISDRQDGLTAAVPKWWAVRLQLARANLITRLADLYDGAIPLIFMGGNSTLYPEPFIRESGDAETRANLIAGGYTAAADRETYTAELDAWSAFTLTRLGWSLNPWQSVNADGTMAPANTLFTVELLNEFRSRFGERAVLQNNSIRTPSIRGYAAMYDAMHQAGGPLSFQTSTLARDTDLSQTIEWAIAQGAHLVELPTGYDKVLSTTARKSFDARLRANV